MTLKPIKNDTNGRPYCGPTAIAAISGRKVSKVLDAIRARRYGKNWRKGFRECEQVAPRVTDLARPTMAHVFSEFGYDMRAVSFNGKMTIDRWAREHRGDTSDYVFIVDWMDRASRFDQHYVALARGKCLDTFTKGVPVKAIEFVHRANPVAEIWLITKRRAHYNKAAA